MLILCAAQSQHTTLVHQPSSHPHQRCWITEVRAHTWGCTEAYHGSSPRYGVLCEHTTPSLVCPHSARRWRHPCTLAGSLQPCEQRVSAARAKLLPHECTIRNELERMGARLSWPPLALASLASSSVHSLTGAAARFCSASSSLSKYDAGSRITFGTSSSDAASSSRFHAGTAFALPFWSFVFPRLRAREVEKFIRMPMLQRRTRSGSADSRTCLEMV